MATEVQPSDGPEVAIRLSGLSKRFGSVTAVDGLDLEVYTGEIFGLVGPDGAGKTTTMRLLCGLVNATSGQAWVAGCAAGSPGGGVRDYIGYVPQKFGLYHDLTIDENMEFYADLFGIPLSRRSELAPRLLAMARLEPFRQRQAGKLSGGMKQKLALVCALLHRPRILLLDEPTNGVDPLSRRDLWSILHQLAKDGITIFLTTSYLDEAERCNRVGLLHRGRLISLDAPETLRRNVKENCYEVICQKPREVRSRLLEAAGVLSVEPSGAALHVFLDSALTSTTNLESTLAAEGLGANRWERLTPSLEDVFIAMIHKSGRAS